MQSLALTQGAFALILLLVWIYLMIRPVLSSTHKIEGHKYKVEWDPRAAKRLRWVILFASVLNAICAFLAYLAQSSDSYFLFFSGIIIAILLIFLITFFAERDNISRINKRE